MFISIQLLVVSGLLILLIALIYGYHKPINCPVDHVLEGLRNDAIKLDPRAASLQFYTSNESYTEDKQKVFLCLMDKQGVYYPMNQLAEILAHELAHAFTNVVDPEHKSAEWNAEFRRLLQRAIDLGMYDPTIPPLDYSSCSH